MRTVAALPAAAVVAFPHAFSRKGASCQPTPNATNGLCRHIEVASSAVQGLRALQELCDRCSKGQDNWGSDPCSNLSQQTLKEVAAQGRSRFNALEHELAQISSDLVAALQQVGDNTEQKRILGATLLNVNKNLENVRTQQMQSLNFNPQALKQGSWR